MENQKIEQKNVEKVSKTIGVSTSSKVAKLQVKDKVKVQKDNSIAGTLTARLDRYTKREKALAEIIYKRQDHITKLVDNLYTLKTALEKTEKQHAVELEAIKELTKTVTGKV